jgi:hypothetical protein
MKPQTRATLQQLEEASWFSKVGIADSSAVVVLESWYEAMRSCTSPDWEDLCLQAANEYRARIAETDSAQLNLWNERVALIKEVSIPLVRRKIESVSAQRELGKAFEEVVQWDILHACMEAEYSDVYPPGFNASQAYWYVRGHFPCGWHGAFPAGKLIVY